MTGKSHKNTVQIQQFPQWPPPIKIKINVTKIKSRPSLNIQDHRLLNYGNYFIILMIMTELNPCLVNIYHVDRGLYLGTTIPISQRSAIHGLLTSTTVHPWKVEMGGGSMFQRYMQFLLRTPDYKWLASMPSFMLWWTM
jgi:hypothetical protein